MSECVLCRGEREAEPALVPMTLALLIDFDREHYASTGSSALAICTKHRLAMARALPKVAEITGVPRAAVELTKSLAAMSEARVLEDIDRESEA